MLRCYKMENSLYICIGTIIGTMIGSIISFLTTLFINHSKNRREDNLYLREKREHLYLEAIDCLYLMCKKIKPHVPKSEAEHIAKEIKEITSRLSSRFVLYASTEVRTKFVAFVPIADIIYNLADIPEAANLRQEQFNKIAASNKVAELIEMMKEEIGTSEKQKVKGFQCNLCSWIQSKFSAK